MLRVEGEALPIGVMSEMEPYLRKSGITAGDYVIMMTDGVADSFLEEQEGLEEYLQKCMEKRLSPQDMADCLLDEAAARWDMEPVDDMSVMVVRVYENTDRRLLQTA
jgi:stage II sporulation protein E